jgi:hypothetical protein
LLTVVRWLLLSIGRLLWRVLRLLLVVLVLGRVLIRVLIRRSAVALILRRRGCIVRSLWVRRVASLGCVVGLRRVLLLIWGWIVLLRMALALSAVIVVA